MKASFRPSGKLFMLNVSKVFVATWERVTRSQPQSPVSKEFLPGLMFTFPIFLKIMLSLGLNLFDKCTCPRFYRLTYTVPIFFSSKGSVVSGQVRGLPTAFYLTALYF